MFTENNYKVFTGLGILVVIYTMIYYYMMAISKTKHFEENDVEQEGVFKKFITAFYFAVSSFLIGSGEIYPRTSWAQLITASESFALFAITSYYF